MPDPFGRRLRSMTSELIEGASDGALNKPRPDWSNRIQDASDSSRELLGQVEGHFDYRTSDPDKAGYVRGYVRGA